MAAAALYGHGTRWRRPLWEEARDGGSQRRWRLGPPPLPLPRCLRREAGRILPMSQGWFRCRAIPALPGAPVLSANLSIHATQWARFLAELPGLGRPRGRSSTACLALLAFPPSFATRKRAKKQLTNTTGCSGLSGAPQPPLLPRHKAAVSPWFSSGRFLSGLPGARGVNPGVGHRMTQWSCPFGWHWDVSPGTAKGWTLVLLIMLLN